MKYSLILFLATAIGSYATASEPPKLQPVPKSLAGTVAVPIMPPEQKEIEKMNDEYGSAFKRGDHKTLAGFYTEDADQTDADGNVVVAGRAAIERQLKDYFAANKGAECRLGTDSVRLLTKDVMLEKGDAVVTRADGSSTRSNFLAIHVKHEGKWLISHLTESGSQAAASPYSHLQELEWMVGSWKDNSPDVDVETTCQWAANRTFLTRSFSANSKERGKLEGTEVLGWDPIQGHIRAWIFDSEGGYSEAVWTRDGNRWLIQSVTTMADGRKASAHHTITRISDAKYTWESTNRVLDGEVRPNIEKIEINRVKSQD